jgi:hypothetical protein
MIIYHKSVASDDFYLIQMNDKYLSTTVKNQSSDSIFVKERQKSSKVADL